MNPHYAAVADRARQRCEYCRAPEQVFNFAFDVEHIRPRTTGGGDIAANLALACKSCNLFKSDVLSAWDDVSGRRVPLFHPRRQQWIRHFRFDPLTAQISGRTATGRVTVQRLRMNSDFQVRARRQWMQLGLYP